MSQNNNEDVFKEKRKPKGEINFHMSLNEEQKVAKQIILDNPVTLLKGMAGSGKTLLACQIALDLVFKREMDKIVITRPTVSKEEIGFFGLHQANKFLVNSIRKRIGVKEECVPITMQNTGNTGPASLPLLLSIEHERLNRENRLEKSILSGFGSGLSCGAVACNLAESKIFSPLEI